MHTEKVKLEGRLVVTENAMTYVEMIKDRPVQQTHKSDFVKESSC